MEKVAELGSLWGRLVIEMASVDAKSSWRIVEMDVKPRAMEDRVEVVELWASGIGRELVAVRRQVTKVEKRVSLSSRAQVLNQLSMGDDQLFLIGFLKFLERDSDAPA